MFRTKISVADGILISLLALLTLLAFFLPLQKKEQAQSLCVTTEAGSATYSLSQDREFTVESRGILLTVEIRSGRARVKSSDCPDHVCSQTGWIEKAGQSILCVPAGVKLTVVGGGADDVDFVAG